MHKNLALKMMAMSLAFLSATASAWGDDDAPYDKDGIPKDSIARLLPANGDPFSVRKALADKGVNYGTTYIGEVWSNREGGLRQGNVANGRLETVLDADLEKLAGAKGLSFHTNAYYIHGGQIGGKYVGNLFVISNIEATPAIRLFELWLEQKFLGDKLSIRAGQLGADTEFVTSTFAGLFPGSTFGWPGLNAINLPAGGIAYPFAAPGVASKSTQLKTGRFSPPSSMAIPLAQAIQTRSMQT